MLQFCFLRTRIYSYIRYAVIRFRKFTLIKHFYAIFSPYVQFLNYPSNILYSNCFLVQDPFHILHLDIFFNLKLLLSLSVVLFHKHWNFWRKNYITLWTPFMFLWHFSIELWILSGIQCNWFCVCLRVSHIETHDVYLLLLAHLVKVL